MHVQLASHKSCSLSLPYKPCEFISKLKPDPSPPHDHNSDGFGVVLVSCTLLFHWPSNISPRNSQACFWECSASPQAFCHNVERFKFVVHIRTSALGCSTPTASSRFELSEHYGRMAEAGPVHTKMLPGMSDHRQATGSRVAGCCHDCKAAAAQEPISRSSQSVLQLPAWPNVHSIMIGPSFPSSDSRSTTCQVTVGCTTCTAGLLHVS